MVYWWMANMASLYLLAILLGWAAAGNTSERVGINRQRPIYVAICVSVIVAAVTLGMHWRFDPELLRDNPGTLIGVALLGGAFSAGVVSWGIRFRFFPPYYHPQPQISYRDQLAKSIRTATTENGVGSLGPSELDTGESATGRTVTSLEADGGASLSGEVHVFEGRRPHTGGAVKTHALK